MSELAELHAQLARLQAIRISGVSGTKFGDREVQYKTDSQIAQAIADLEQRIAGARGQGIRTIRFSTSKGV